MAQAHRQMTSRSIQLNSVVLGQRGVKTMNRLQWDDVHINH